MLLRPLLSSNAWLTARYHVCQRQTSSSRLWLKCYSSRSGSHDRIQIPIHNNGHIDVDIFLPARRKLAATPTENVHKLDAILHLPSHPPHLLNERQSHLLLHSAPDVDPAKLSQATSLPVIQPHYRLGPDHLYPTPIHDVAVAYNGAIGWLRENLKKSPKKQDTGDAAILNTEQLRIGLVGDFMGGSLALALGLTECRVKDAARVVAVSASKPILDWVFEHDTQLQRDATMASMLGYENTNTKEERKAREGEVDAFHALRHSSFPGRQPYKYFDPFASPLHFLRSPSGRIPTNYTGGTFAGQSTPPPAYEDTDEDPQDSDDIEDEQIARAIGAPQLTPSPASTSTDSGYESASPPPSAPVKRPMAPNDPRRFKRPLRYPSADHAPSMLLPRLHISIHPQSLLRPQAEDFVRLLRRGLLRGKGHRMSKTVERVLMDENLLAAEEQEQAGHEMPDERIALVRQGVEQFQLTSSADAVNCDNRGRESELAEWLVG